MTHDRTQAHQALLHDIRLQLGREPDLVLWAMSPGGQANIDGRPVRCGPVGMADLVGICRGRFFALECKTGKAQQNPDQVTWMKLVRSRGGFYAVVHSVAEAVDALRRCRAGNE